MKRKTVILFGSIMAMIVVGVSVYAFNELFVWERPISVEIVAPELGVYLDKSCTVPISEHGLDLGEISAGARTRTFRLYIRNEGEDHLWLTWSSTVESETDGKIENDWWCPDLGCNVAESYIDAGQVLETHYNIWVRADCPLAKYSWTLCLGVND